MKHRLSIIAMISVFVTGCLTTFSMAENPCRQRLFKICKEDEAAMICQILSYDEPETIESVSIFLKNIGKLDLDVQKDLICARLMGRKNFLNIDTMLDEAPDSDGQYSFQSGIGSFCFKVDDVDYPKLIDAHNKLKKKMKLCPKKNISFGIQGMVAEADAEYSGSTLKSFVLKLQDVKLSNITTPYTKGGFDVQRKPLEKKIDEEYQRYFNAGIKKKRKSGKKGEPKSQQTQKKFKTVTNKLGMEFVRVPAGFYGSLFECGSSAGIVTEGFYIGRYEVTQGQWKAVMGNNPSHFNKCGDNCPVEMVSWDDTQKFINKMNQKGESMYRLPTETEWEYAARAGSDTAYCFGDNESELSKFAWYDMKSKMSEPSVDEFEKIEGWFSKVLIDLRRGLHNRIYEENIEGSTHPVGQLVPNNWDLYDMHGNVWEWCQEYLYDIGSYRVLRGGGWGDVAGYCQSAARYYHLSGDRTSYIGFRLVFSPGQK